MSIAPFCIGLILLLGGILLAKKEKKGEKKAETDALKNEERNRELCSTLKTKRVPRKQEGIK